MHLFLECKELNLFLNKCKEIIKELDEQWNENEIDWNRLVMFGWERKRQNMRFINLCVMLMKSAIWERRIVAKREKKVMDVWRIFRKKTEMYMERLYAYCQQESLPGGFYDVFTPKVCDILERLKWTLPDTGVSSVTKTHQQKKIPIYILSVEWV